MDKQITKKYSNGEITIVWQPHKCIHSAICFNGLPTVFDPRARPWVTPEGSDSAAIMKQIDKCPSGALSYLKEGTATENTNNESTVIELLKNGPLLVNGNVTLKDSEGKDSIHTKPIALCRCGHSQNKPFCDGNHSKNNFIG